MFYPEAGHILPNGLKKRTFFYFSVVAKVRSIKSEIPQARLMHRALASTFSQLPENVYAIEPLLSGHPLNSHHY